MFRHLILLATTLLALVHPPSLADTPPFMETIGGERPIQLKAVDIEGHLAGLLAQTTFELTFYNPNARQLEGQLRFPFWD